MTAPNMLRAALAYAALGWRVLPCQAGGKLPILRDWPNAASTDPDVITEWWRQQPNANIATATGAASGLFVLDIDGAEGEAALVDLERRHGPLPELFPQQWSGSGKGWHAFFRWPDDVVVRNSASRIGRGVDVRGEGGACMLAPSLHPSGRRYQWAPDRSPRLLKPEPAPAWLLGLAVPPPPPPVEPFRPQSPQQGERYALTALRNELALVASAPSGRRNHQLNASAHALYRLADKLPPDVIRRGLLSAAAHAGLSHAESEATIRSAARARGVAA